MHNKRLDPRYLPLVKLLRKRGWVVKTNFTTFGGKFWPIFAALPGYPTTVGIGHGERMWGVVQDQYILYRLSWEEIVSDPPHVIHLIEAAYLADTVLPLPVRKYLIGLSKRKRARLEVLDDRSGDQITPQYHAPTEWLF